MDRLFNALLTDDSASDDLKLNYYLLSSQVTHLGDKAVEVYIKNVKFLLLSSKTRYQGLTILSHLLPTLSNDILSSNCSILLQSTIKILQESTNQKDRILAYKVLTQLLSKLYLLDLPNLTRDLSNCMNSFLSHCFSELKLYEIYYAANCLSVCASMFPSAISSKRGFLENKIIETIATVVDSGGDEETLKALGFCYSKVVLAGSSTLQKYREFFSKLMNTLKQFRHLYDVFSIAKPSAAFTFENDQVIPNVYKEVSDIFVDPLKNIRRLYFLSGATCSMITGQHSTAVPLPVEAILECLNQFMIISNGHIKESHSTDVLAIGHVLPILYENIFYILKALLTSCKQNIIIFARLVNRIVISSLEWLDKVDSVPKGLYLKLRFIIYSFLGLYFTILGGKSSFSTIELHLLVKHLAASLKVTESNLTFATRQTGPTNPMVQKDTAVNSTLNSIRALTCIVTTLGCALDSSIYVLIQNETLSTLLHIYRNWFNLASPYKNEQCRHELIDLLKSLLINSPINYSPPLETAIVIFTQAQRLEKSPLVKSLLGNCFQLIDFIMDARIYSQTETLLPKIVYSSQPQSEVKLTFSPQTSLTIQEQPLVVQDHKEIPIIKAIPAEIEAQIPSSKNIPIDNKKLETKTLNIDTNVQGNKRKNTDTSLCSKVSKTAQYLTADDSDIIFEGVFSKDEDSSFEDESPSPTIETNQSNMPFSDAAQDQATETTQPNEKTTSADADDVLNYFVMD